MLFHWVSEMLSSVVLLFISIRHFQGCKRKYIKSLTNKHYKTSFKTFHEEEEFKESSQCEAMVGYRDMGEALCTDIRPGQPLPHRHWESGIELAPEQTHSLPRSMHCNPRPMVITGHCSRDTGGPELNEDTAKTARLNVTSKHKGEKHDYCPLLGSGEAHLECCVLSGVPQGERQRAGPKCH